MLFLFKLVYFLYIYQFLWGNSIVENKKTMKVVDRIVYNYQ